MTGPVSGDINLDITYQDGLRLSELYGRLGDLQYNLEHLDFIVMQEHITTTVVIVALAVLIGILIFGALAWLFNQPEHANAKVIICMALYIVAIAVITYSVWDYTALCVEVEIERDIQSTQMQIDAILMKYGWTGI